MVLVIIALNVSAGVDSAAAAAVKLTTNGAHRLLYDWRMLNAAAAAAAAITATITEADEYFVIIIII